MHTVINKNGKKVHRNKNISPGGWAEHVGAIVYENGDGTVVEEVRHREEDGVVCHVGGDGRHCIDCRG